MNNNPGTSPIVYIDTIFHMIYAFDSDMDK